MSPSVSQTQFSNDDALDWMHKMMAQDRRCDEENSARRHLWKQAKAAGHNVAAMRRAIKHGKDDPILVVNNLRDEIRYSGLRHIPVTPESLFDGLDFVITEKTQIGADVWDCEENAYQAGRHGAKLEDNPYDPGTELHVHWVTWWHKGQEQVAREKGDSTIVAAASRTRPRRRRQDPLPLDEPPARSERQARAPRRPARRRVPAVAENGATVY